MIMANKCTGWGSISTFQHQNWKKKKNSTTDASINLQEQTPPPKKNSTKRKNLKNWQQNLKFSVIKVWFYFHWFWSWNEL